jgi:hypothetical protein
MRNGQRRRQAIEQNLRGTFARIFGEGFQDVADMEVRHRIAVLFANCVTLKLARESSSLLRARRRHSTFELPMPSAARSGTEKTARVVSGI